MRVWSVYSWKQVVYFLWVIWKLGSEPAAKLVSEPACFEKLGPEPIFFVAAKLVSEPEFCFAKSESDPNFSAAKSEPDPNFSAELASFKPAKA